MRAASWTKGWIGSVAMAVLVGVALPRARAWNYPGHRMINQVALAALPKDFPDWVREPDTAERIAWLSGQPDRWRDTQLNPLQQYNALDHFIDLEEVGYAGISLDSLTPFLYDFTTRFAAGRAEHADRFRPADPARDREHLDLWPGFLPWSIYEYYAKLQVEFSVLHDYETMGGTTIEIANTRQNIAYLMGVMGHFVGDGSQPLHTTIHFYGWFGRNPKGYTTAHGFHGWIDGGFIAKAGITKAELLPKVVTAEPLEVSPRADGRDPVFVAILDYLVATHRLVEPLYQLEKEHKLEGDDPGSAEGRAFIDQQLLRAGEMLSTLWVTAWSHPTSCRYLENELRERAASTAAQ